MLKRTFASISLPRLLLAMVLTVLVADCIPHPALGPSLTRQALSELIQPVTAAESHR